MEIDQHVKPVIMPRPPIYAQKAYAEDSPSKPVNFVPFHEAQSPKVATFSAPSMGRGARHPNSSNFNRWLRPNVVYRLRRLVASGVIPITPRWLVAAERAPPLDLTSIHINTPKVVNPYNILVRELLAKYPDLRFQDCFVQGNHWAKGYERYRDDHPIMQFVAQQLRLMKQGYSKNYAFKKTEAMFRGERLYMERQHKMMMALGLLKNAEPLLNSIQGYYISDVAQRRKAVLQKVLNDIKDLREHASLKFAEAQKETHKVTRKKALATDILAPTTSSEVLVAESSLRKSIFDVLDDTPGGAWRAGAEQSQELVTCLSSLEDLRQRGKAVCNGLRQRRLQLSEAAKFIDPTMAEVLETWLKKADQCKGLYQSLSPREATEAAFLDANPIICTAVKMEKLEVLGAADKPTIEGVFRVVLKTMLSVLIRGARTAEDPSLLHAATAEVLPALHREFTVNAGLTPIIRILFYTNKSGEFVSRFAAF